MKLAELPTPAPVVDVAVLESNLLAMAQRAAAAGVALRPHAKTHKTVEIARRQLAHGARGLTLAKTSEAEVYADRGFDDIFVAYPVVGADKARRLLALAERIRLMVGVDSLEGARTLADVFAAAGRTLDVMLKIDTGFHRVGVLPEAAVAAGRAIAELKGLRVRGVFTHAGHGYAAADPGALEAVGRGESGQVAEVAARLREAGVGAEEVSVGSTPTARAAIAAGGITECRPGSYVFNDGSQVELGIATPEQCALTVVATVVSVPAPDRAVIDAGSKSLSNDPLRPRPEGLGRILGTASRLVRLSEEHGVVQVAPGDVFRVGQRVRVLPNHCCAVANLSDALHVVEGEDVVHSWRVVARGCVQ